MRIGSVLISAYRKLMFIIVAVVVLALWTIGTYRLAYYQGHQMNTPKQAVAEYIHQHPENFPHTSVLSAEGKANGGYFLAAKEASEKYLVFYTTVKHGHFVAQYISNSPIPKPASGKQLITQYSYHVSPHIAVISTKKDNNIGAIIGYVKNGDIPFSYVQIGNLPLWGYCFIDSSKRVEATHVTIYSIVGKVIENQS